MLLNILLVTCLQYTHMFMFDFLQYHKSILPTWTLQGEELIAMRDQSSVLVHMNLLPLKTTVK